MLLQGILDNTDPRAVRRNVAVRCVLAALCMTAGNAELHVMMHPAMAPPRMLSGTADHAGSVLQD